MKKVLYVIIGIVVIYLVLCLFGPKQAVVSRSIIINAPAEAIQAAFVDFKFFKEKWSPWTEKDPNMTSKYEGEVGKVGSKYSWEAIDKVGTGSMELLSINKDTVIEKLAMTKPRTFGGDIYFITKPEGNATNVTWELKMDVGFKMRGMMMFMSMEKYIAPDYEKGLANLKKVIEEKQVAAKTYQGYEVKEVTWEERTFFGKKSLVKFEKMAAFFGENFPKIGQDLGKNKIEPTGAPSCIYFTYDDAKQETECAAVFPVANGTEVKGWEKFTVPAAKVLQIEYFGPYNENMKKPHMAMDEYMKEKGLTQTVVLEEYVTDPMTEKDSTKWQTNVYYVLKK